MENHSTYADIIGKNDEVLINGATFCISFIKLL